MRSLLRLAVLGGLILGAAQVASAQSHTFTFEGLTDEGWGGAFNDDAGRTNPIVNIGGSNRMQVSNTDGFQETAVASGTGSSFFNAMAAAAANPAGYELAYDWYVDTTGASGATFLQFGSYVNTGSSYYAQNFPGTGKEVELNGTQLASGQTFSGSVTVPFTAYGSIPAGETFLRLGLIENSGTGALVPGIYFDNISIRPIPEPASLAMLGLGVSALALRRRGRTA